MSRLSGLKPRRVVRAFRRLGWTVARQRGSHCILTKAGNSCNLSVPIHAGSVKQGLLRSLLVKAGISIEEFLAAYR